MVYALLYRTVMKIAHRFHWHYAPPSYPNGDTMLWCQWCGFRQVVKRNPETKTITLSEAGQMAMKAAVEAERRRYQP